MQALLSSSARPGRSVLAAFSTVILVGALASMQACTTTYFHRLSPAKTRGFAFGLSDNGKSIAGEMDLQRTTGAHFHGVRWDLKGVPPRWVALPLPFPLPQTTMNNASLGISPDGNAAVGSAMLDAGLGGATDTAFVSSNQLSVPMPFLTGFQPIQSIAVGASRNGDLVVGWTGADPAHTDITRFAPSIATLWTRNASGNFDALRLDGSKSSRANDISYDGRYIVGAASSEASFIPYGDVGVAYEACLWEQSDTAGRWKRTWLGFPAGSARNYSKAFGISSDATNTGVVIAGVSGGVWIDGIPTGDDSHMQDQRPTVWRITNNVVHAHPLPAIRKSQFVHAGHKFGAASAVSKSGAFIVGSVASLDDTGGFQPDAVIWGWGKDGRAIREILLNAGIDSVNGLTLSAATGVSEDGRVVCGLGYDSDGIDFAWVARIFP